MIPPKPQLCDTLPQAKLAQTAASHPSSHLSTQTSTDFQSEQSLTSDNLRLNPAEAMRQNPAPSQRKLCPRHKRMADEGTNLKLQQVRDRQRANACPTLMYFPFRLWMPSLCRNGRL